MYKHFDTFDIYEFTHEIVTLPDLVDGSIILLMRGIHNIYVLLLLNYLKKSILEKNTDLNSWTHFMFIFDRIWNKKFII